MFLFYVWAVWLEIEKWWRGSCALHPFIRPAIHSRHSRHTGKIRKINLEKSPNPEKLDYSMYCHFLHLSFDFIRDYIVSLCGQFLHTSTRNRENPQKNLEKSPRGEKLDYSMYCHFIHLSLGFIRKCIGSFYGQLFHRKSAKWIWLQWIAFLNGHLLHSPPDRENPPINFLKNLRKHKKRKG